ncbi:ATP-binding protein [Candidatus Hecatella orcuttiae]|uniref:ATP-binding protein n=1 Tax=Candidatus Hecatella orcuttiae TaxID=1935119 RepID=UPI002867E8FE|nr:DUF87 domain-containing protein [Candidatus Hecatella orcuttiae]
MKFIGRIADGSTEASARVILLKNLEGKVAAEELVLVHNGGREDYPNQLLGVLRGGLGKNEFLTHTSYRPDVAYMKYGGEPSGAREVYSFSIKPIGVVAEGGIEPNLAIIQPRSPVYLLEEEDNPLHLIVRGKTLWMDAYMEGHESWRIPVKHEFIPYHVGVYGSTGSGKSWFTRYVLIPLYLKAGYRVFILDWSGTDYAPYYRGLKNAQVMKVADIALDEESVLSYLEAKTFGFGRNDNIRDAFDTYVEGWVKKVEHTLNAAAEEGKDPAEFLYGQLRDHVEAVVNNIDKRWKGFSERAARRVFRRLKPEDLKPVMGTLPVESLFEKLEGRNLLVVDMGGALTHAKLGFFLALARHLYGLMEAGENLKASLVVDEAPQYAPWEPRGIQAETTETIKNLTALGRKRMLNLTLIAQGIKGEIGINASVRRNLNTHFFGRIHPLDAGGEGGASEWLSPYGITSDQMLQLKPGRFYFSGVMNPSPVPLLITYQPPEGAQAV